ncbi:hypothetical protein QQF64_001173 [Cirrhinus molitorella]|uniref:Reverse transcriptase/retrotransposon-derived protein RNase H-like domain-containing protein n=1 Tax=Cirrhinus molitorella TaxID=172907 RepID=A0ABR3P0U0_9TELE
MHQHTTMVDDDEEVHTSSHMDRDICTQPSHMDRDSRMRSFQGRETSSTAGVPSHIGAAPLESPGENGEKPVKTRLPKQGMKNGQLASKTPVQWTSEHSAVVARLVDMLMSSPILAYPDFNLPFVLQTETSNEGLGAVLYQEQGGKLRVITYGSRSLSPAEKNYHLHSNKLKFLALKWAICDKFCNYLYYAPTFMVFTDNNPLTYILSTAKLSAIGHCWVGELADFHFTIKYRPGKPTPMPTPYHCFQ